MCIIYCLMSKRFLICAPLTCSHAALVQMVIDNSSSLASHVWFAFLLQDDVMLPERVRLQYEASVLHPNSVSSLSNICTVTNFILFIRYLKVSQGWISFSWGLTCDYWLLNEELFLCVFFLRPAPPFLFLITPHRHPCFCGVCLSSCVLSGSWCVEQCDFPVLTLSVTRWVRGQRSRV